MCISITKTFVVYHKGFVREIIKTFSLMFPGATQHCVVAKNLPSNYGFSRPVESQCQVFFFNILLTVHISTTLVNDQLDAQFFYIIRLFQSSTCSEQHCAHHEEVNCINTASGTVTLCRWPSDMQPAYQTAIYRE